MYPKQQKLRELSWPKKFLKLYVHCPDHAATSQAEMPPTNLCQAHAAPSSSTIHPTDQTTLPPPSPPHNVENPTSSKPSE